MPDAYFAGLSEAACGPSATCSAAGLAEVGFVVYPPDGTYFVTTDIRALGAADGVEFCRDLPRQAGVVAIPNSVFYDDAEAGRTQVRFAFCKRPEVLQDALARIEKWASGR